MGLYDRDYVKDNFESRYRQSPRMHINFPRLTPVVKYLLIINVAVYFLCLMTNNILYELFAVDATSISRSLQVWRLVTYQFLHDPNNFSHIAFNMLGLYFLGPTIERHWGSRKFIVFYLGCGVAGGIFYLLLASVGWLDAATLIGASGSILGMLAACAILFPHFVVFLLFFPVPIRVASIIFTVLYMANLLRKGANAGGDAAHLAGMAAGTAYVLAGPWLSKIRMKMKQDKWHKKIAAENDLLVSVDQILDKVHRSGVHSLTSREKKILEQATRSEQMRNAK